MRNIVLTRVDERLIHGQVMTSWLKLCNANVIVIIDAASATNAFLKRILFAAAISVIGKKIFRKKGWFYAVAGYRARSIDGPCHNTIPPYNHYVVLGPLKPDQVAKDIAARVGYDVAIVDINDLEGQILGASSKAVNKKLYARILKDNPLGQDDQQTPMGIIRRVD